MTQVVMHGIVTHFNESGSCTPGDSHAGGTRGRVRGGSEGCGAARGRHAGRRTEWLGRGVEPLYRVSERTMFSWFAKRSIVVAHCITNY